MQKTATKLLFLIKTRVFHILPSPPFLDYLLFILEPLLPRCNSLILPRKKAKPHLLLPFTAHPPVWAGRPPSRCPSSTSRNRGDGSPWADSVVGLSGWGVVFYLRQSNSFLKGLMLLEWCWEAYSRCLQG